jgi:hypothetical protein
MFEQQHMPQNLGTSTSNAQTNSQDEEQVAVDLNQKVEVADPTKDFNIVPPPPPAKEYPIQWELAEKDGIDPRASKKVGTFLQCHFVGKILAEGTDYNGYTVNEYMNSIYNNLKGTSPLHDFLHKLGHTVSQSLSVGELKTFTETALAQRPVGTISLEWRLSYKDPSSPRANKDGYVALYNRMSQFTPKNPDGSHPNVIASPVDGTPLYAQAYVFAHLKK